MTAPPRSTPLLQCARLKIASPWRLPRAATLAGLVLGALAAQFGCADLLGYGDYEIGTTSTGGTTTSSGGATAGTGGTGGAGGSTLECTSDADCKSSTNGHKCDLNTNVCVECVAGAADTCALGLFCGSDQHCAFGCAGDDDCNPNAAGPLTCDVASHQCMGCGPGAPCPAGGKCNVDSGACVLACDFDSDCPGVNWACCNKQCTNVATDVQNCGACENACVPDTSTTWVCVSGGCVFESCLPGWIDCDQDLSNGCECGTMCAGGTCQ